MAKNSKKKTSNPVGRPTKLTPEVRAKIEEAAALDCSVEEIAYYADISRESFYRWLKEDPEFSDRIDKLRQRPVLKARTEIVKGLDNDKHFAMTYLTKKRGHEFGDTVKHQHSGAIATDDTLLSNDMADIREKYEVELRERIKRGNNEQTPKTPSKIDPIKNHEQSRED